MKKQESNGFLNQTIILPQSVSCNYFGTPKSTKALQLSKEGFNSKFQLISVFIRIIATHPLSSAPQQVAIYKGATIQLVRTRVSTYKLSLIKLLKDFSSETLEVRRQQADIFKLLKGKKTVRQEFYVWENYLLRVKVKLRHSQIKAEGVHCHQNQPVRNVKGRPIG